MIYETPIVGRARHSVRAVVSLAQNGAHRVTRPTSRSKRFVLGRLEGERENRPLVS